MTDKKKLAPLLPLFASIDDGEEHKYSFQINVYGWERAMWILEKRVPGIHAQLILHGHLTNKRFILEPPKKKATSGAIFWAGRIAAEVMKAALIGRFVEVAQEQESELKKFTETAGFVSIPYYDIARFEIIRSYHVSMVLKTDQKYYERLTFIPYTNNGSSVVSEEFIEIANTLIRT